ncbi:MAG: FlgD immunoglobulin-like domain containing protein [Fibrobacterota bacterium]
MKNPIISTALLFVLMNISSVSAQGYDINNDFDCNAEGINSQNYCQDGAIRIAYNPTANPVDSIRVYLSAAGHLNVPADTASAAAAHTVTKSELESTNPFADTIYGLSGNTRYYLTFTVSPQGSGSWLAVDQANNPDVFKTTSTAELFTGWTFDYISASIDGSSTSLTVTINSSTVYNDTAKILFSSERQPLYSDLGKSDFRLTNKVLNSSSVTHTRNQSVASGSTYYFTVFTGHVVSGDGICIPDTVIWDTVGQKLSYTGHLSIGGTQGSKETFFNSIKGEKARIQWGSGDVSDSGFIDVDTSNGFIVPDPPSSFLRTGSLLRLEVLPEPSDLSIPMRNNIISFKSGEGLEVQFYINKSSLPVSDSSKGKIFKYDAGSWAAVNQLELNMVSDSIFIYRGLDSLIEDTVFYQVMFDTASPSVTRTSKYIPRTSPGQNASISYTIDQTDEDAAAAASFRSWIEYETCSGTKCITRLLNNDTTRGSSVFGAKTASVPVDTSGGLSLPVTQKITLFVSDGSNISSTEWFVPVSMESFSGPSLKSRSLDTNWHMVSVPAILPDTAVLGDIFTGFEDDFLSETPESKKSYRFFRYDGATGIYSPLHAASPVSSGEAIWVKSRVNLKMQGAGFGHADTSDQYSSYSINLTPAWRDISIPFAASVTLRDILTASGLTADNIQIFEYNYLSLSDFGWHQLTPSGDYNKLSPWKGYTARALGTSRTLKIPHPSADLPASSPKITDNEPSFKIVCGIKEKGITRRRTLSAHPGSSTGDDRYDIILPPSPEGKHFGPVSSSAPGKRLLNDFRPITKEGVSWTISLDGVEETAEISLLEITGLPDSFSIVIEDLVRGISKQISEKTDNTLSFVPTERGSLNMLKIHAGSDSYLKGKVMYPSVPDKTGILNCRPNPFNPTVKIAYSIREGYPDDYRTDIMVYNSKGRTVRKLVEGPARAGTRYAVWNGRDAAGTPQSSGVYIIKMEISDGSGRKVLTRSAKVTLLK